jgi:hypothetical protein
MVNIEVFVYDRRKGDKPEMKLQVESDGLSFSEFKQTLYKVCLRFMLVFYVLLSVNAV